MKKLSSKNHPIISFAARGTLLHEAPSLDQWVKGYFKYKKIDTDEALVEEKLISCIHALNQRADDGYIPEDRFPILRDFLEKEIGDPEEVEKALEAYSGSVKYVIPKFVIDTCIELKKRNFKLCVVSNEAPQLVEFMRLYHLLDYFDSVYIAEEVGKRKPDPDFIKLACEDLDVEPQDLIHVGDQYAFDVVAAQKAGGQSILYDPLQWEERASRLQESSSSKGEKVVAITEARNNRYWSQSLVVEKFGDLLECLVA